MAHGRRGESASPRATGPSRPCPTRRTSSPPSAKPLGSMATSGFGAAVPARVPQVPVSSTHWPGRSALRSLLRPGWLAPATSVGAGSWTRDPTRYRRVRRSLRRVWRAMAG
jgi:hypothetical protein